MQGISEPLVTPTKARNDFDRLQRGVLSKQTKSNFQFGASKMEGEKDILFVRRDKDGAVTLYIDEDWAAERGVDPSQLVKIEIPRELYANGTVQQLREYAATVLESLDSGTP